MRLIGLFSLIGAVLNAGNLTVDHVTVAGIDLKEMQARLASVGLPSEYGGAHSNRATQMAITSFPDGSYLELIALQTNPDQKSLAGHYWSEQMRGNAGPTGWAVRSGDVAAEAARLRAAGIAVGPPARSGRQRPDGTRLDWETAQVGSESRGTFFPFLIRDITPRNARAFPNGSAATTEFPGVAFVVIGVRDLKESVERYRKAYELPAPLQEQDGTFGARLASFDGTPVILAQSLDPSSWLAKRLERFGEGPCAFLLGAHKGVAKTRWFGHGISWLDPEKLGWRLGFIAE